MKYYFKNSIMDTSPLNIIFIYFPPLTIYIKISYFHCCPVINDCQLLMLIPDGCVD